MKRACLLLAMAVLAACSDSTSAPTTLHYGMDLYRGPSWAPTGFATVVNRGDTVTVHIELVDSTTVVGSSTTVRAVCAENVSIRRNNVVAATLPSPATCPDSAYPRIVGLRYSGDWDSRLYNWVIPASLAPGTYTIVGEILVSPALAVSQTLTIN